MDTQEIRLFVETLDEHTPIERLAQALEKLDMIRELERELRAVWKSRMLDHIQANGEVTIGSVRYYAGSKRKTKAKASPETMTTSLLDAVGGDVKSFAALLSSDAFKHGACKQILTVEQFGELFEIVDVTELKEGKPAKELLEIDERFVGRSRSQGKPELEQMR